jgi:hypothetical protein
MRQHYSKPSPENERAEQFSRQDGAFTSYGDYTK